MFIERFFYALFSSSITHLVVMEVMMLKITNYDIRNQLSLLEKGISGYDQILI